MQSFWAKTERWIFTIWYERFFFLLFFKLQLISLVSATLFKAEGGAKPFRQLLRVSRRKKNTKQFGNRLTCSADEEPRPSPFLITGPCPGWWRDRYTGSWRRLRELKGWCWQRLSAVSWVSNPLIPSTPPNQMFPLIHCSLVAQNTVSWCLSVRPPHSLCPSLPLGPPI